MNNHQKLYKSILFFSPLLPSGYSRYASNSRAIKKLVYITSRHDAYKFTQTNALYVYISEISTKLPPPPPPPPIYTIKINYIFLNMLKSQSRWLKRPV